MSKPKQISKDKILLLRKIGYTYSQIAKELGCSKCAISYHLNDARKNRTLKRQQNLHPFVRKAQRFKTKQLNEYTKVPNDNAWQKQLKTKIRTFHQEQAMVAQNFTVDDVIQKFGTNPICYLTGERIDIYKPSTYQFDHIIPISRGGTNSLDNLGICTKRANMSKSDMTYNEFIAFCKTVYEYSTKGGASGEN